MMFCSHIVVLISGCNFPGLPISDWRIKSWRLRGGEAADGHEWIHPTEGYTSY